LPSAFRFPPSAFRFLLYPIHHHKVALVPVDDAGMGRLGKLLKAQLCAQRPKADAFCCIANPKHGDAQAGVLAALAQGVEAVRLAKMLGHHAQARGAAVHGV